MAYGTLNAGAITPGSGNTLTVSETVNVATSLQLAGTAITSTATEINLLDGSSATNATVSKAVVLDGSGNIAFPTGKGIDFSATADGSGTATSELLDDYEEGTWTPKLYDVSTEITTANGAATYTKIGRYVHCEGRVQRTDATSYTSSLGVSMPFSASVYDVTNGNMLLDNAGGDDLGFATPTATYVYWRNLVSPDSALTSNQLVNNRYARFSFSFKV